MKVLDKVLCICYLVQFKKDKDKDVLALLDFKNKINAMTRAYTAQLGIQVQKTDVNVQKIDRFSIKTHGIVIAAFQVLDKLGHFCFF